MGGAYHILIELDPSKIVGPEPDFGPSDPASDQKRRERKEFMQALGEDPRREILRRERNQ